MIVKLINTIFSLVVRKQKSSSQRKLQWQVLKKKLAYSSQSAIGEKYNLKKIKSIADYQKAVPVHRYEDVQSYWDKEIKGEQRQSVNDAIKYFVWTSGTGGVKKLIPVTNMVLNDMKKSHLFFSSCIVKNNPQSKLLLKKIMVVAARANIGQTEGNTRIGMISGIMHEETSMLLKSLFLPHSTTINIEDEDEKLAQMAKEAKWQKIGALGGIPAFILKVIAYMKASYTEEEFQFFSDNLEVVISSGTNYRLYKERFYNLLGKKVDFFDIYTSSEGSFGYQSDRNPDEMEFFDDMVFFEFIKLDEFIDGNYSKRYLIDELEEGQLYTILITVGNGTFSYANEDVIQCVNPQIPTFNIVGRTTEELNLSCEKTSRIIIEKAVLKLEEQLKSSPDEFFVTGVTHTDQPHYIWVFEEKGSWADIPSDELAEKLDEKLREVSELYNFARDFTLKQSTVIFVKSEIFEEWHQKIKSEPYHKKIPKIISDLKKVEKIIGKSLV